MSYSVRTARFNRARTTQTYEITRGSEELLRAPDASIPKMLRPDFLELLFRHKMLALLRAHGLISQQRIDLFWRP